MAAIQKTKQKNKKNIIDVKYPNLNKCKRFYKNLH